MRKVYYAHTSSHGDKPNELLIDHLQLTAKLAAANGLSFHSEKICKQIGLLHDVGKRTDNFQDVLAGRKYKQDHAIVGGIYYYYEHGVIDDSWLKNHIALILAAHHSCLYTYHGIRQREKYYVHNDSRGKKGSEYELEKSFIEEYIGQPYYGGTADDKKEIAVKNMNEYREIQQYIKEHQLMIPLTSKDYLNTNDMSLNERMFYVRMLLSCLVDADYSATIEYQNPGYLSKYFYDDRFVVDAFLQKLNQYHKSLIQNAKPSIMNDLRNEVYTTCEQKGKTECGFLTLTAPTGSGKTLALMKFALEQAKAFGQKRIIVVLPYLSIIDQNGSIYKDIFGENVVLIDNSQTDYTEDTRVYADRWSSPIIVTTSVKFFQTLFASKTTDLRRLHSIANSIVVFDECQTLSTDILNVTLEVLQSLTKYYNTTVLFSTATKPSYEKRNHLEQCVSKKGNLYHVANMQWSSTELMDDVPTMFTKYAAVKNTKVIWKTDVSERMDCQALINYYYYDTAVLYVFNMVRHAIKMYQEVVDVYGKDGCYLITSRFNQVDKLKIIEKVNNRLKEGKFVRLISTQCVEAGVDFDFPCGARAYAPLDSVIQTAGRINRNGRYSGKFLVFQYIDSEKSDYPSAKYMDASNRTLQLSCKYENLDFYNMKFTDKYFARLYSSVNFSDAKELYSDIWYDDYKKMSEDYRVIDKDSQINVLVRPIFANADEYDDLIAKIRKNNYVISKKMMRILSKYTVSISSKNGKSIGTQLYVCTGKKEYPVNWFLSENPEMYGNTGFDCSKNY